MLLQPTSGAPLHHLIQAAIDGLLVAQHPAAHHRPFLVFVMYHTCLWTTGIFQHLKGCGNSASATNSHGLQPRPGLLHPLLWSFDLKVWSMIEDLQRQIPKVVMCRFCRFHVLQLWLLLASTRHQRRAPLDSNRSKGAVLHPSGLQLYTCTYWYIHLSLSIYLYHYVFIYLCVHRPAELLYTSYISE